MRVCVGERERECERERVWESVRVLAVASRAVNNNDDLCTKHRINMAAQSHFTRRHHRRRRRRLCREQCPRRTDKRKKKNKKIKKTKRSVNDLSSLSRSLFSVRPRYIGNIRSSLYLNFRYFFSRPFCITISFYPDVYERPERKYCICSIAVHGQSEISPNPLNAVAVTSCHFYTPPTRRPFTP